MVSPIKPYLQMACETFSFADEQFYILDCGRIYFFFLEGLSKISSITCTGVRKMQVQRIEQLQLESWFCREVFYSKKEVLEYDLVGVISG